jgi:uncharacterized membrane protein YqjE
MKKIKYFHLFFTCGLPMNFVIFLLMGFYLTIIISLQFRCEGFDKIFEFNCRLI